MATTKAAQRGSGSSKATSSEEPERAEHRATVTLPYVTAQFRVREVQLRAPEIHLPSLPDRAEITEAVSSRLPTPTQAVYYGSLVALGVLELIQWPVVVAIGVGTAIAQQACAQQRTEPKAHSGTTSG